MIERLFVCLLVSLAGFAVRAAPVAINVVDATNGRPLAGAIGHAAGVNRTADRDGAFSLELDANGTRVSVRAAGYARTEVTLTPAAVAHTIRMTPMRPKAVYLSAYGVADRTLRDAALALRDKTAINALVIDVKGDSGVTPYRSQAREISGAANNVSGAIVHPPDLPDLLRTFHARGLYLIARIVVFKDDPLARAHPEWAVRDAAGEIWEDREHQRWIDPTSRAAWQHNYDVAEEAARMGFDEIQFDYLRFPDANGLRFAEPNTEANRVAAISGFLTGARAAAAVQPLPVGRYLWVRLLERRRYGNRTAARCARAGGGLRVADAVSVRLHVGPARLPETDRASGRDRFAVAGGGEAPHRAGRCPVQAVAPGVSRLCIRSPAVRCRRDSRPGRRGRCGRHGWLDAVEPAQSLRSCRDAALTGRPG